MGDFPPPPGVPPPPSSRACSPPCDGGAQPLYPSSTASMQDEAWVTVSKRKNRSRDKGYAPPSTSHPRVSNYAFSGTAWPSLNEASQVRGSKLPSSSSPSWFRPSISAGAKLMSWASLVSGKKFQDTNNLAFYPPSSDKDKKFAEISKDEIRVSEEIWGKSLLIYVVGSRPHFHSLHDYISQAWSPYGKFSLYSRENGIFVVKLDDDDACSRILEDGPWMINRKLLIVRRWSSNISMDRDLLKSIPIWVRFPSLHLKFWNPTSIARIASIIGIPSRLDDPTSKLERLDFARVLVEISADFDFPSSVFIKMEDDQFVEQSVTYEWKPPTCTHCHCIGHESAQCSVVTTQVWRAKRVVSNDSDMILDEAVDNDIVGGDVHTDDPPLGNEDIAEKQSEPSAPPLAEDCPAPMPAAVSSSLQKENRPDALRSALSLPVGLLHCVTTDSKCLPQSTNKSTSINLDNFAGKSIFDILDAEAEGEDSLLEDVDNGILDMEAPAQPSSATYTLANPMWEALLTKARARKERKTGSKKKKAIGTHRGVTMDLQSTNRI